MKMRQENNMTLTQKLMSLLPIHIGQRVRLTRTILPPDLAAEREGEVVGIELRPGTQTFTTAAVTVLHTIPEAVHVKFDDLKKRFLPPRACSMHVLVGACEECENCEFFEGVVAVMPETVSWRMQLGSKSASAKQGFLSVKRTQFPLAPSSSKTIHGLQGTTADPGLIAHFLFPRSLSKNNLWLAIYVLLSRARRLASLWCIGCPDRSIIEGGPPAVMMELFQELFGDKVARTKIACREARADLGWPS